jgi:predicted DNA-binding protein
MEDKRKSSVPVQVRMPAELKEALESLAVEEGRSLSGQVVFALKKYLQSIGKM